ncbi:MAG: 3-methyl-2-oxobutanoate hydroxymethyltransferase [Candidatus Cloacimonetes bacterium 4572_55]|nr:MAG: 3-methyl-2-oxobutanoate hydroxymethyltransferase [Candidatus Cloacimonetes bacterium 4572_55]
MQKKVTIKTLRGMKRRSEKICMLTAYDYLTAKHVDAAGVDAILVGDSAAMVFAGYENTLPITLDEMLYHVKAVNRGRKRALLVGDMPFLSYQVSQDQAIYNAGRMLKEGGAEAVKLEGGEPIAPFIDRMTRVGIPVMGHLGMTPQSVHQFGGYKLQAKCERSAERLLNDAAALEQAGCFAIVLEKVPYPLAGKVSEKLKIPTIGIGAGPDCDGQVLVVDDMLGIFEEFDPKFLKRYANLATIIRQAVSTYVSEVKNQEFPTLDHSYS